jgi:hypothetical protein
MRIILKPNSTWSCTWWRSPGGNIHMEIHLYCNRRLKPMEIVALQAILGSDWRREAFNFVRAIHVKDTAVFQERYNILFTKKVKR